MFVEAQQLDDPKERLRLVYEAARTKKVCATDEDVDDADGDNPEEDFVNSLKSNKKKKRKHRHGGCGSAQPKISRNGLRLEVEWKGTEVGAEEQKKRVLTAEDVRCIRLLFYLALS